MLWDLKFVSFLRVNIFLSIYGRCMCWGNLWSMDVLKDLGIVERKRKEYLGGRISECRIG